jgi:hypothetical protein
MSVTGMDMCRVPALSTLVEQVLAANKLTGQKFHVVVVPEDDMPRVESFDDVSSLMAALKRFLNTENSVFPILGTFMPVTEGPYRFLMTPFGALPLFNMPTPETMVADAHGWMGGVSPGDGRPTPAPELQEPDAVADLMAAAEATSEDDGSSVMPAM